jgi:hypothetical protein
MLCCLMWWVNWKYVGCEDLISARRCVSAVVWYSSGGVRCLFEVCGYMPWYGYTRNEEKCMYCDTTLRSLFYKRVKDARDGYVIKEWCIGRREVSLIFKRFVGSISELSWFLWYGNVMLRFVNHHIPCPFG